MRSGIVAHKRNAYSVSEPDQDRPATAVSLALIAYLIGLAAGVIS